MKCKRIDGCSKGGRCDSLGVCFIEALQLKRWLRRQEYTRACTLDPSTCLWRTHAGRSLCGFKQVVDDIIEVNRAQHANRGSLKTFWLDENTFYTTIITDSRKISILNRDKHCLHCGTNHNLTIDHIIPLAKGGSNALSNLQALCASCNVKKGDSITQ